MERERKTFRAFSSIFSLNSLLFLPYFWLFLFLLIPFLILVGISFSESVVSIPPYESLITWTREAALAIHINFGNYLSVFKDPIYVLAYLNSFKLAFLTTIICLMIAYPAAYCVVLMSPYKQFVALAFLMVPFWISFLARVCAWIGIFSQDSFLCIFLSWIGLLPRHEALVGTPISVLTGLVYTYLPFMILPLYSALEGINHSLIEAALDLGCRPLKVFFRIIVPLSFRGALTGAILVLIPVVGEFVIPELLGGSKVLTIGQVIWFEFFYNHDWPMACALAIVMLFTLLLPIIGLGYLQKKHVT